MDKYKQEMLRLFIIERDYAINSAKEIQKVMQEVIEAFTLMDEELPEELKPAHENLPLTIIDEWTDPLALDVDVFSDFAELLKNVSRMKLIRNIIYGIEYNKEK